MFINVFVFSSPFSVGALSVWSEVYNITYINNKQIDKWIDLTFVMKVLKANITTESTYINIPKLFG